MKKYFFIFLCFFLFLPHTGWAVELFFHSPQSFLQTNWPQSEYLAVYLNTQGETINAVEGEIILKGEIDQQKISWGNSHISLWVEEPHFTSAGNIRFAGVIPGGISHSSVLLFKLAFLPQIEGELNITATDVLVYLHDGQGNSQPVIPRDFTLEIKSAGPNQPVLPAEDTEPPDFFQLQLVKDKNLSDNQWAIIFSTIDKGSGIDFYQLQESKRGKIDPHKWQTVISPAVLADQNLHSHIFVRAIDQAGNQRLSYFPPQQPLAWWEDWQIWVIIIIGIVVPLVFASYLFSLFFKK